jgi:xanthine dehydrogenase accessory factor
MRALQQKILELIDAGRAFAVATVAETRGSVPGKAGAKLLLLPDGTTRGTVGGAGLEEKVKALCRKALEERRGGLASFDLQHYKEGGLDSLCGGSVRVVVEYYPPAPHLLLCGGGHCGLEVARLCDQLGYAYSVLDERPEYASAERFPSARGRYGAAVEVDLDRVTHVLLLGWSHRIDTDLLERFAPGFPGWIGLIASRSKREEMFRRLKARGIPAGALDRVHAPVGLPIGAETPAEIAVSILAQVIADAKGRVEAPAKAEVP